LTDPGLSVIIKAVESARQIFERMTSYTTYRIAMTIDIMFFVVIAMTLFHNFRPLTPVMIVILALLDDIPIMTIAYDNAITSRTPVRWDMGRILSISLILGLLSVIQSSGLLMWAGSFSMPEPRTCLPGCLTSIRVTCRQPCFCSWSWAGI
jgi:H+-transporting ATPase